MEFPNAEKFSSNRTLHEEKPEKTGEKEISCRNCGFKLTTKGTRCGHCQWTDTNA